MSTMVCEHCQRPIVDAFATDPDVRRHATCPPGTSGQARTALPEVYYSDSDVTLYQGDMRVVLPQLDLTADCIVADPPYGETALSWDRWPDGWPDALLEASRSMWCFGSMRMFLERAVQFSAWRMSQDVVWEKHAGSGPNMPERFMRVHEHAVHWYRGSWNEIHREQQRVTRPGPDKGSLSTKLNVDHRGEYKPRSWTDDGTRAVRSVIAAQSMHQRALHPTEKPGAILRPLIEYACPPGGLVLDPFAGSGSTAVVARLTGRRAVLIEADERYCEVIATRLAQGVLPLGDAS